MMPRHLTTLKDKHLILAYMDDSDLITASAPCDRVDLGAVNRPRLGGKEPSDADCALWLPCALPADRALRHRERIRSLPTSGLIGSDAENPQQTFANQPAKPSLLRWGFISSYHFAPKHYRVYADLSHSTATFREADYTSIGTLVCRTRVSPEALAIRSVVEHPRCGRLS